MKLRNLVVVALLTFSGLCAEACACCPPTVVVVNSSGDATVDPGGPGQSCGGATCTRPPGSNGCVVSTCGVSPTTGKKECQLALVKSTDFKCECMPGDKRACPSPSTIQQSCVVSGDSATGWTPAC